MRRGAIVTRYVGIRHATWVQAISDSIAEEAIALGVPLARIFRIPNGVDTHRFRPATEAEKAKLQETLPITGSTRVVLFAGRFSRQKGLHDLLDAWTMLEGADALLVLVGSTEVRDPVPIPTNLPGVLVRPWVPHIETYYRAADIFVLPSHVEGMSNALLEAMACGLPAVVTRVGANQQVVSDGETGLLLDPGDRPSLQRCLRRLIDDAPLSRLMGERAHVSVGEQYGIERVIDSILQVLATQVHSERSAF
jgi:glycosyltransferase involved in cell wall biosynthesis